MAKQHGKLEVLPHQILQRYHPSETAYVFGLALLTSYWCACFYLFASERIDLVQLIRSNYRSGYLNIERSEGIFY